MRNVELEPPTTVNKDDRREISSRTVTGYLGYVMAGSPVDQSYSPAKALSGKHGRPFCVRSREMVEEDWT